MATSAFIAVVDDDASVREALCRLLRYADFTCAGYGSTAEFLAGLAPGARVPDCLVLDVHLPGSNGLALQRTLASRDLPVPIVFITGDEDDTKREQALAAGAVDYLFKPFTEQVVLAAIERALAGSEE